MKGCYSTHITTAIFPSFDEIVDKEYPLLEVTSFPLITIFMIINK